MSQTPTCPTCHGAYVPFSDHDRRALHLAALVTHVCPRCHSGVVDGDPTPFDLYARQREERGQILHAIRTDCHAICSTDALLAFCKCCQEVLSPANPARYANAACAPYLLTSLWELMRLAGGTAPPDFPTALLNDPHHRLAAHECLGGTSEAYIQDVVNAIGAVIRWCEARTAVVDPTKPGYLDLIVDELRGEVRREGKARAGGKLKLVRFDTDSAEWHTFLVAFRAGERGATKGEWERDYPDGPEDSTHMRKAKMRAKEKLADLDVEFAFASLRLVDLPTS